ncbi:FAD-dependent oxidoreductase [Luteimonas pelagia]
MDLKSGYPFWAVKNGLMHAFPKLEADLRCDVAIVGGGITAALVADELAAHGHEVAVLEQRDIGWGSSAASTALLQYEIDTHLVDLANRYGDDAANQAYLACAEAIPMLHALAKGLRDVDFARMDSLYFASKRRHVPRLREELVARRRIGLDIEWLPEGGLRERFGIDAPGALLSALAARLDPYRMAYRLMARLQRRGAGVFDRTRVVEVEPRARSVRLRTAAGHAVTAGHVVVAAGYESQRWLRQRLARNRSSYAFITDPMDVCDTAPLAGTMVWESARPYLYLRTTGDGRMLVGGEDDSVDVPARRDRRVDRKARTLVKRVAKAIPGLDLVPAFAWAGTFAETEDGLPFFGPHAELGPRVLFAMAYGGNGITYSMAGAGLLRAHVERRRHPLAPLFGFERNSRRH